MSVLSARLSVIMMSIFIMFVAMLSAIMLIVYAECCCGYYRCVEGCYASHRYAECCKLSGFLQSVIKPRVAPPIIFFSCYVEILIFFSFYLNDSASFSCKDNELVRGVALQLSLHLL